MRYMLLFLIIFGACKSKKEAQINNGVIANEACLQDGNCFYEILKNQKLELHYDTLGALYATISKGENLIFKFEYKRKEHENTQDSSYREEVLIQLDPDNLEFETTNFKGKNILFARWCYCKGETGYYKIPQGKLSVKKIETNKYQLSLVFNMEQVPQVISQIKHDFSLE